MIDGMDTLCYDVDRGSSVMIFLGVSLSLSSAPAWGGGLPLGAKSKISMVL